MGLMVDCLNWLSGTGTESPVLLGAVFSFNTGVALLRKFKEELNQRLLSAVKAEIDVARNAGWLGNLGALEDISSVDFRQAVRTLVLERDRLQNGPLGFVKWSAFVTKALMLDFAALALACMAHPCTARWTALLILPYPVHLFVSQIYESCKVSAFRRMRNDVKSAYDALPSEDKRRIEKDSIESADVDEKIRGASEVQRRAVRKSQQRNAKGGK